MLTTSRPHVPLALIVVTVAGCSQSATGAAPGGRGAPGAEGTAVIKLSDEDKRSLYLAEETLTANCMHADGFEYRVVPPPPQEGELRPYGNDDVDHARRHGFGIGGAAPAPAAGGGDGAAPIDANAAYVRSLPPERQAEYQAALTGPPDGPTGSVVLADGTQVGFTLGGCAGDARKRLYGDADRYLTVATFVENLDTEIANRVLADDTYASAVDRWRTCMRREGMDLRSPAAAREAAAKQPARETEIAVLSATCAGESRLVETAERVDRGHRSRVYREHEGRVIAYTEMMRSAVKTAKRTLRGA